MVQNFTHFSELLLSKNNISISTSAIKSILMADDIIPPKTTRSTRKKFKLKL